MRRLAPSLVLVVAFAAPVLLTKAAQAETAFCSDLNAVLAEAPGGFESLKGTLLSTNYWQSDSNPVTAYAALRTLSGAVSCMVENDPSNQTYPKIYTCAFAPAPTKVGALDAAATSVADCVGKTDDDDVDIDSQSDVGDVEFDRPNYKIDLVASDTQSNVRFVIFPK